MATQYNDFRVQMPATGPGTVTTARGKGAVASVSREASELAIAVLDDGGNAFDAAFSLAFSLCVYHPQAGNIGGGGYLLFTQRGSRQPKAINFREQSSVNARREAFLLPDGAPDPEKTAYGPRSVCVPGTVKAFFTLQQRHGRLRARDLLLAIAKRAEEGAVVTQYEADCLNRLAPKLAASPESRRIYVKDEPFKKGDRLRNPPLARTLELLAREGEAAFYRGRIAEQMVADLGANGGFLSAEDLADYAVREPEPIFAEIEGKRVWTVPPEAGGALILQILNILDRSEFYRHAPWSPEYCHYLAQASKITFVNRLEYLADGDVSRNRSYQSIFDEREAERLFGIIDPAADAEIQQLAARVRGLSKGARVDFDKAAGSNTTHFSVIDAEGNAVSSSYTMNLRYGSKWSVAGAGFLLNGSVDAFSFTPGKENYFGVIGSEANLFAARKRPASNMAPVLVTENDRIDMVLGTPGGPTIPTTMASLLLAMIAHGVPPDEAIARPRLHHQGWPDVLYKESGPLDPELSSALSAFGYTLKDKGEPIGDVHGVFRIGDEYVAVSDYRREGRAAAQCRAQP